MCFVRLWNASECYTYRCVVTPRVFVSVAPPRVGDVTNHVTNEETIDQVLREIATVLAEAGIESAQPDAELLLAHVLGVSRGRVHALAVMRSMMSSADHERVRSLAAERAARAPLQHLTGRAPFRGIELAVGPGVFVPRPETEVVAQLAIDALLMVPVAEPLAVDLCTGSGTLALAIANEVPTARVWAVEQSVEAHAWAQRNVAALGDGRVELRLGDVAALDPAPSGVLGGVAENAKRSGGVLGSGGGATDRRGTNAVGRASVNITGDGAAGDPWATEFDALTGRVHVLVSNPPYVPSGMVPRDPEVRDHDPALALYGGEDGLDLIRVISRIGRQLVIDGGMIVLEHAEGQGAAIRALLSADGWRSAATHQDLTMRDRATTAVNTSPAPGWHASAAGRLGPRE